MIGQIVFDGVTDTENLSQAIQDKEDKSIK